MVSATSGESAENVPVRVKVAAMLRQLWQKIVKVCGVWCACVCVRVCVLVVVCMHSLPPPPVPPHFNIDCVHTPLHIIVGIPIAVCYSSHYCVNHPCGFLFPPLRFIFPTTAMPLYVLIKSLFLVLTACLFMH